jgi:hypothetical protein
MTSLGKVELVIKHDDIVSLGREFEGIGESRFLNCCLVDNSWKELYKENVYYPVNIHRFAELGGLPYHKAYHECKEILTKYTQQIMEVKLGNGAIWHTHLIYDFISDDDLKVLKVRWNREIIPLVSGKGEAGKFSYYDARMDSVSSTRIYHLSELIQRNKYKLKYYNRDSFTITTEEIREVTGTSQLYPLYKELNRTIIQPTLKAIYNITGEEFTAKGNKREVTFHKVKQPEVKSLLSIGG